MHVSVLVVCVNLLPLWVFLSVSLCVFISLCLSSVSIYVSSGVCLCVSTVCVHRDAVLFLCVLIFVYLCIPLKVMSESIVRVCVSLASSPAPENPSLPGGVRYLCISVLMVYVRSL